MSNKQYLTTLQEQTRELNQAAHRILDTVTVSGWTPDDVQSTLEAVDILITALGRLGPETVTRLAPVWEATEKVRTAPTPPPRRGVAYPRRPDDMHRNPVYWVSRDMRVADQLWADKQDGNVSETGRMYAELSPWAMVKAMDRRRWGENWDQIVRDLYREHVYRPRREGR